MNASDPLSFMNPTQDIGATYWIDELDYSPLLMNHFNLTQLQVNKLKDWYIWIQTIGYFDLQIPNFYMIKYFHH